MKETYRQFFKMIKGSLNSESVKFGTEEEIKWDEILDLANMHKLVPMIYESSFKTEKFKSQNEEMKKQTIKWKELQTSYYWERMVEKMKNNTDQTV